MSVPPNLTLEKEVRRAAVPAASGPLGALDATPPADTARRPAVLLVPGYTGSKEDFLPVLGPLARAGHRTVAIDLRGQLDSPGPDDPSAYTVPALAKDVAAVLAWLGEPAHLLGHSFGGLVTRRAVIDGARPLTLTLLGSGPAALGGHRASTTALMIDVLEGGGGIEPIADAAVNPDDPRLASVPDDVRAFLRQRWFAASPTGLVVMGRELTGATDEVAALRTCDVPTLVAHGETDDAWSPAEQREMAERLGARYEVIAGSVHSPACESPAALVEVLLDFWATAG